MDERGKIATIRTAMPAVTHCVYLNTGTFGPLPRVAVDAIRTLAEREFSEGRITAESYDAALALKVEARAALAELLHTTPDHIALTRHTTDGMNLAIMGRNWQPGDEIVTTDAEHPGTQAPIFNVVRRYGVTVRTVRLNECATDVVAAFERLIGPRTRMVVFSHVTWTTGSVLPVREIAELARGVGALVVVDGAQSAGAIPTPVTELGADVYAIPGQKWLCGPEGTGAVYFSDDALDQLQLTIVGYASLQLGALEPIGGYFVPKPTAERFEVGGTNMPAIAGQVAALRWLRDEVGYEWIFSRIQTLASLTQKRLCTIPGVRVLTPAEHHAGLVTFTLDGCDPQALVAALARRNVIVRWITRPYAVRVSTGFYNDESDIEAFIAALAEAQRELTVTRSSVS